jgi:hypothetical protein
MVFINIEISEGIIFPKSSAALFGSYTESCIVIIVVLY